MEAQNTPGPATWVREASGVGAHDHLDRGGFEQLLNHVLPPEPGALVEVDRSEQIRRLKDLQTAMTTFRIEYKFGIDEVLTKINILREEFEYTQNHSPIEHVRTRLKTMESLLGKVVRTKCPLDLDSVRTNIRDIAGIRVVCAFASDVYWIAQMLSDQPDITVVEVKDYIAKPKPNGYQSLHLIVQVPVFLSDRTVHVYVELQIRTIAMDFWASLEHKIYYKYDRAVPSRVLDELKDAARVASELDAKMARLRDELQNPAAEPRT